MYQKADEEFEQPPKNGRSDVVLVHSPSRGTTIKDWDWTDTKFSHGTGYSNKTFQAHALNMANKISTGRRQCHVIWSTGYDSAVSKTAPSQITGTNVDQLDHVMSGHVIITQLETTAAAKRFNDLVNDGVHVVMFFHTTC